jgi:hypothetical protein
MDFNTLIGGATTLVAVPLTWWLARLTAARANADADRATLQNQAGALMVAVADIRGAATTNHLLRESWRQQLGTIGMVALAFVGGAARAIGSEHQRALAGAGDAARLLAQERHHANLAADRLPPLISRVAATAYPLLSHPDAAVAAATNELFEAAYDVNNTARIDEALVAFGAAVRAAAAPPRSLWARLRGI